MDKLESLILKAKSHKKTNWLYSKIILERGLKDFPNEKVIYIEIGDLFTDRKIYKKALEYYTEAYKIDPEDDDLNFKIANVFLILNKSALALNYLLQIKDKTTEVLYNISYAYSQIGKTNKSIMILEDLISQDISTEIPYLFLSEIYYTQRKSDTALKILEKTEKKFGPKASIYYLKASVYAQKEYWLQAVFYYKRAKELSADYPHFYRNYAIALYKLGNRDAAIFYLKENIQLEPDDDHSYFYLIKLLIEKNDLEEAQKYLEKAKKENANLDKFYIEAFEMQIKSKLK